MTLKQQLNVKNDENERRGEITYLFLVELSFFSVQCLEQCWHGSDLNKTLAVIIVSEFFMLVLVTVLYFCSSVLLLFFCSYLHHARCS